MTESELAAHVVAYLEAEGRDVYQEVKLASHNRIADIVAKHGPVLWVLETKKSLSLELLAQAHDWLWYAHLVSVVVPEPLRERPGKWPRRPAYEGFVRRVLADYGIGLMYLCTAHRGRPTLEVRVKPAFRRPRLTYRLAEGLCAAQKTFAKAGTPGGSVWTPYQETCRALTEYVTAHPGAPFKDAVDAIRHHYASDKSAIASLKKWIENGSIDGVRLAYDQGKSGRLRIYPTQQGG